MDLLLKDLGMNIMDQIGYKPINSDFSLSDGKKINIFPIDKGTNILHN